MLFPPVVCFLLCVSLSAEQAKALPFSHSLKHKTIYMFGGASRGMSLTELAFLSIFITAIIFLIVGAFLLSVITDARVAAVLNNLRGNPITRLRRLHAASPFAAFDGTGRAGLLPRRNPTRRGGLSYPMSASRTRRHQRQSHHLLPL